MKKTLTFSLVCIVFFVNYSAFGQILLDENFDYPAGDSLGAHGWVYFSGVTNTMVVVSPGLTYTGYPLSGIGNAARVRNNGNDNYKAFSESDSTNDLYVSFMVNIDSASTGDYFLALLPDNSTTFYCGRVYVKDSSGTLAFGLSKFAASQGPVVYSPAVYQYNTTYLLVLKYMFRPATMDDSSSLFVFSSPTFPSTEPVPTIGPITNTTGNDPINLGRVALRQGTASSSPTLNIDGIRVAKLWTNITAIRSNNEYSPVKYYLSNNYPNPFNPSTNIDFEIPYSSYVTLKVFDILGRELAVLINGNLTAGTYTYNFNASNLPSGTYFYRLSANEGQGSRAFSQTKTMVLVK